METPKSKTLLYLAHIPTGFSAVASILTLLTSTYGGEPFSWNEYTVFFLFYGLVSVIILFSLSKNHRKLSGILLLGGYAYLILIDTFTTGYFSIDYTLALGCIFSPPLIAGILYILSAREVKRAGEQSLSNSIPSHNGENN